jgi:hypothetical protein
MAPRTNGGLAREIAHGGNTHHENYEFIGVRGPAPASAFSCVPDLCSRDLDPAVYGGHTLGTALSGSILEFTYIGGPVPSLATGHGQVFHPGSQRPMAHGKLTQGMTPTGHILLGNRKVIHTNGSMPITSFYPTQANRVGSLGLAVKPCPEWRLRHQWNTVCQGTHE